MISPNLGRSAPAAASGKPSEDIVLALLVELDGLANRSSCDDGRTERGGAFFCIQPHGEWNPAGTGAILFD